MAHTYDELKHKNMSELQEIAAGIEHEALKGAKQLTKNQLLKALATALGIDAHEHHEVVGIDKAKVKVKIRELRKKRDEILGAKKKEGASKGLKHIRREIHRLKRRIHKATV